MELADLPLCVDLDLTFSKVDTLGEAAVEAFRHHPWRAIATCARFMLSLDRARLKQDLADICEFDAEHLPVRQEVIDYLVAARGMGRKIYLVTAANQQVAEAVARNFPYFDGFFASSGGLNLKSSKKADFLVEKFGLQGFEYIGDCSADIPVWEAAVRRTVIASGGKVPSSLASYELVPLPVASQGLRPAWKILRLHQWAKNILVFVPILTSHRVFETGVIVSGFLGFIALGCVASMVYIINDTLDVQDDRRHPEKRNRPLASGSLSLLAAFGLVVGCGAAGIGFSFLLPLEFKLLLAVYAICSLSYALWLKRLVALDILMLAWLYVVRILLGGAATAIGCSKWLLVFAALFFLGLAMLKRVSELIMWRGLGKDMARGRGYSVGALPTLTAGGIIVVLATAAVIPFYVKSPEVLELYHFPLRLLIIVPVILAWQARIWHKGLTGRLPGDPVLFAIKDPVSYILGVVGLVVVVVSV